MKLIRKVTDMNVAGKHESPIKTWEGVNMAIFESIFSLRHNRWFGVHNPFGSDMVKAADPHISLWALKRLLNKPSTRMIAAENLLARGDLLALRIMIFETSANKDLIELAMQKAFSCLVMGNDQDFQASRSFLSSFNYTADRFFCLIGQLSAKQVEELHGLWGDLWAHNFGQGQPPDKLRETESVGGHGRERRPIQYREKQTAKGVLALYNRDEVAAYRVKGRLFLTAAEERLRLTEDDKKKMQAIMAKLGAGRSGEDVQTQGKLSENKSCFFGFPGLPDTDGCLKCTNSCLGTCSSLCIGGAYF